MNLKLRSKNHFRANHIPQTASNVKVCKPTEPELRYTKTLPSSLMVLCMGAPTSKSEKPSALRSTAQTEAPKQEPSYPQTNEIQSLTARYGCFQKPSRYQGQRHITFLPFISCKMFSSLASMLNMYACHWREKNQTKLYCYRIKKKTSV